MKQVNNYFTRLLHYFAMVWLIMIYAGISKSGLAINTDSLLNELNITTDTAAIHYLADRAEEMMNTDPSASFDLLVKAEEIAKKEENRHLLARVVYLKGDVLYIQANYQEALFELFNALDLYEEQQHKKGIADAYNKIGSIYIYQGDYPNALDYFFKSLKLKDEINDTIGISNTYTNIGNIFFEQYNLKQALNYFFKSIEIDERRNNEQGMAKTFINIGLVYLTQADYENALDYFKKSLAFHKKHQNQQDVAICYTNIAIAFEEQGKYEEALSNYQKSLDIYKEIGAKQGIASTLYNIGYFYSVTKNYAKSIEHYKESLKIAQEIGSLPDIVKAAYSLSEAYKVIHKYKEAYNYYVYYKQNNDKLNNEKNIRKFTQLEMQYAFDKKQKEQELLQKQKEIQHQAEIKRRNIIVVSLSIGVIFLVIFAVFVYRSYQQKKKDNELLRRQKEEIEKQRDQISRQKQEITDSIHYAKRIQTALLPPDSIVHNLLPEHFILFLPRDIVSGDYYWISQKDNKVIMVAADCTGHGVPGAFMSMLGISFLNEIISQDIEIKSDILLNELRKYVIRSLRQTGQSGESKDGMDLVLTVIDFENNELQYSGAYNPLLVYRNAEIIQIKADKMPIGISDKHEIPFTSHHVEMQKGDTFYMFSDGYVDQFGGPDGKKFMSKKFKNYLLELQSLSMQEQKEKLHETLMKWKGNYEQIDDILVVGFRV